MKKLPQTKKQSCIDKKLKQWKTTKKKTKFKSNYPRK